MQRPIAITGTGIVSPAGLSTGALWQSLIRQDDLSGHWQKRDLQRYPVNNVVSISEELWSRVDSSAPGATGRSGSLAMFAVNQAIQEADLPRSRDLRLGCVLSTTTAGVEAIENDVLSLGPPEAGITPSQLDGSAVLLPQNRQWTGPTGVLSNACSSGLVAPGMAIDILAAGEADVMIAGGLDILLEYTICGFNGLRLTTEEGCRPFAAGRRGAVLSEGVACLCMEPLEAALARGASVKAVVTGYGISCDAGHTTAPDPEGIARAIREALERSGTEPEEIGGVFAHATGTQANDSAEVAAMRIAFGCEELPPITAVKAVIGHAQAGAGALTLLAAIKALEHAELPPTAGLSEVDPALNGADVVVGKPRPIKKKKLMINAFGFGGNNGVMIVSDLESVLGEPKGETVNA